MRAMNPVTVMCFAIGLAVMSSATPADAACKRMGFLVNDYGKDGPTKDAKELLDKDIAKKMAAQGVKTYKVGTKSVKCELFLNFIVFDEHTCTAEATVCWDGTELPKSEQAKAGDTATPAVSKTTTGSVEKPAAKPAAKSTESKTSAPAAATAEKAADKPKDDAPKVDAAKADTPASEPAKTAETPASDAKVEPVKPAAQ